MHKAMKYFWEITIIMIYGFIILSCDVNNSNSDTPNTDVPKTKISIKHLSTVVTIINIDVKRLDDSEKYVSFFSKSTNIEPSQSNIFILPSMDWKKGEFVWVRITLSDDTTTAAYCEIKPGKQHNFIYYSSSGGSLFFDGYE